MAASALLLRRLRRRGRPSAPRAALRAAILTFDFGVVLLPVAAFVARAMLGPDPDWLRTLGGLLLGVVTLALAAALIGCLRRGGDPYLASRLLDETTGGRERFLTAYDLAVRGAAGPVYQLLARDVLRHLATEAREIRVRAPIRPPHFLRAVVMIVIAGLILVLPSLGRDGFEARASRRGASAVAGDGPSGGDSGDAPSSAALSDRIRVVVSTDKAVYALGEEIVLDVRVESAATTAEDVPLVAFLRVDADRVVQLPTRDWSMPRRRGEALEGEFPLKDRLEGIGAYARGLLTLDVVVARADRPDDPNGSALGNRVVIQITDSLDTARTRYPQVARRNRRRPQPESRSPSRRPEEKKPEPKKPAPRHGRDDRPPRSGPAPGEIDAKPFVVEPLVMGDQKRKRRVRVFERNPTKAARQAPPPAAADASRSYERTQEAPTFRLRLTPRQRDILRRYAERLAAASGDEAK